MKINELTIENEADAIEIKIVIVNSEKKELWRGCFADIPEKFHEKDIATINEIAISSDEWKCGSYEIKLDEQREGETA